MTLADAIRKGSTLRPQAFCVFQGFAPENVNVLGTCVLGAAYEGFYGPKDNGITGADTDNLRSWFPILDTIVLKCPETGCPYLDGEPIGMINSVGWLVTHVNDLHRWSREKIADWIETIE